MPTWPQQVWDVLDGVFHVSDRQINVRRSIGLSQPPNVVLRVHEE